ncbi:hypothetical protein Tco_0008584 [Tanacetum coccineum]
MKNRIYTLSKNDLKDLVKTCCIPLDLHPRLPDLGFTVDHLPDRRAIPDHLTLRHSCSCVSDDLPTDGYDRNDVERMLLGVRRIMINDEMSIYDFMTLPSWGDAKVAEEPHHLSLPLLERVPSHTTALVADGAMILLPTPNEIAASLLDLRLAKKSKGPSQARVRSALVTAPEPGQPSKKRRPRKRYSEAGSSALKLEIGCAPPFVADVSDSGLSYGGTLVHASTSGRGLSLGGAVVSGYVGKSGAEILEDDFGTITRGEEIDLTLFPLTHGPYQMSYPYESASSPAYTREEWNGRYAPKGNLLCKDIFKDPDVCQKALDRTITPAELKRTKSLLPLDLANRFNVLSDLLVSHGVELNSRYTGLVSTRNHLQEKFDRKAGYVKENRELCSQKDVASVKVKELRTELTDAKVASIGLSEELSQTDAKLSDQALVVRDLHNHLALDKARSQGYKDAIDGLREERGLRMGRTDVEFEAAVQKVSNFRVGTKADFDKALVDFPTTPFPFLNKISAASGGTLFEVTQVLPDKHIHSVIPASAVPSIVNEDADRVLLEHASNASTASI